MVWMVVVAGSVANAGDEGGADGGGADRGASGTEEETVEREDGFRRTNSVNDRRRVRQHRSLKYLIGTLKVDVNKASDSDGATALHCAAAGGSHLGIETVKLLVEARLTRA
ncbi:hypothetical protein OSB04_026345 [Centaurea solstitialis]|uniref:Uncharacterized protein n=1 Tax=Centaurea solstitialis TaxID=347529 RepID=A0AA38W756_9ASTR|nr:hypothetical protein OSB04_026345 [Centaurea solstitialis]